MVIHSNVDDSAATVGYEFRDSAATAQRQCGNSAATVR